MKHRWLLILFTGTLSLHAAEPILGMLESIESNRYLTFSIGNQPYRCQPYGVLTLEELLAGSTLDSRCKEVVSNLYRKNPHLKGYGAKNLKRFQRYHIEPKQERCTVYAQGTRSYAEKLLRSGLAMRKPLLYDELWLFRWKRAQKRARNGELGLWKDKIWIDCVSGLYAEEE